MNVYLRGKNNKFNNMAEEVLALPKYKKIPWVPSFISKFEGPPKGTLRAKIIKLILQFEKNRLPVEVFSALELVFKDSTGTRKDPLKILYSQTQHGQLSVSLSVNNDDRFFGIDGNRCLHDVLHRGLAYVINLDDEVQRLNGIPKFFEQKTDYETHKTVVNRSIALKLNGEFIVVTISNNWVHIQSKTASMSVFIGDGRDSILVNALRDLAKKIKEMMNDGGVPQTNQAMAIILVKLLRLEESDRMVWLGKHDGHQFICELETGRHFVQHRGEPTLTMFSKWIDGKQFFPEDLEDDIIFERVKHLPRGATEKEVQEFIDLHKFGDKRGYPGYFFVFREGEDFFRHIVEFIVLPLR